MTLVHSANHKLSKKTLGLTGVCKKILYKTHSSLLSYHKKNGCLQQRSQTAKDMKMKGFKCILRYQHFFS